jgi:DNA-binding NtrC family response regulator
MLEMKTEKSPMIDSSVDKPTTVSKRLLLISDVPERLQRLGAMLRIDGVEMTRATSAEDIARACERDHDLAVVDVSPGTLDKVLRTVRESALLVKVPLLVESSRVSLDPAFAGLLPSHRAMACSLEEMKTLIRDRVANKPRKGEKESRRPLI